MNPAVVAVAYNRPDALTRLLGSISRGRYPASPVPLVVSIDRGPAGISPAVSWVAERFEWPHGPKRVIERDERLGVVGHFRACGALTQEYGGIVLLEDDLFAAPPYYTYAQATLERYGSDQRIGGICLYALSFNGFTQDPFLSLDDGSDVFFMKLPYTQGLAFSAGQWQRFEEFAQAPGGAPESHDLHPAFSRFGPDEWFPQLAAYLAAGDRYFCFPRSSLTTGWGDAGAHFEQVSSWFQTPLKARGESFRLPDIDEALAVYDSFYEIQPDRLRRLGAELPDGDFDLDLYATKSPANLHSGLLLTTRPTRKALATFGLRMYPPELNVANAVAGGEISLARAADVDWGRAAELEARRRLEAYFWVRHRPSRRRALTQEAARLYRRLRRKS